MLLTMSSSSKPSRRGRNGFEIWWTRSSVLQSSCVITFRTRILRLTSRWAITSTSTASEQATKNSWKLKSEFNRFKKPTKTNTPCAWSARSVSCKHSKFRKKTEILSWWTRDTTERRTIYLSRSRKQTCWTGSNWKCSYKRRVFCNLWTTPRTLTKSKLG